MEEVLVPTPHSATPDAIIRYLVAHLVAVGRLSRDDQDEATRRVLRREQLGSTAIGHGVAVPNCIGLPAAATGSIEVTGRCAVPVRWPGALDDSPVQVVHLTIARNQLELLRALERHARLLHPDPPAGD